MDKLIKEGTSDFSAEIKDDLKIFKIEINKDGCSIK